MKKSILYIFTTLALLFGASGCDDFGDVNIDPESIAKESMDYKFVFTNVQQYCYGTEYEAWRNGLIYISTMIQHTASTESYWNGDKYTYSAGYNSAYWDRMFPNAIRDVVDILENWKDKEEYRTEYNMARVLKVLLMQRLTDMYGDIPYTEAGHAYSQKNYFPAYDTQEFVYNDMLKELNEAGTYLDNATSSSIGAADIMYNGNINKWRKFTYSLMLRVAMRLSKVDPGKAETWVKTAVAGGVFESNDDSAIIEHPGAVTSNNTCEPFGKIYCHEDPGAYRMSESFVNLLKDTKDPRLIFLCTVVVDPSEKIGGGKWETGDTTTVVQIGMPNGYDQLNSTTDISKAPNFPGHDYGVNEKGETIIVRNGTTKYSVANRYTYARIDAPTFIVTHAETQLLLAEAAYHGWTSGSAETYYNSGVTAAMEQFRQFGISGISDSQIQEYLKNNPFNSATALEQINTQYYINTFSDEYESFANWRRSGYPILTPVVYVGNVTNGTIPRRFTYPSEEASINSENYLKAVANLSDGDKMTSRVWWDK